MARICIYGAGLVGCYLGGRLLAAGGDIRFIGRPAIGDVLQRDGLTVSHYDGRSWHVPPEAIVFGTDAAIAKDCDLVLATVKSGGTAIAARDLAATSRQAGRRRSTGSTARSSGRPGRSGRRRRSMPALRPRPRRRNGKSAALMDRGCAFRGIAASRRCQAARRSWRPSRTSSMILATKAGRSSGLREVTTPLSVTTSLSSQLAPALMRSCLIVL